MLDQGITVEVSLPAVWASESFPIWFNPAKYHNEIFFLIKSINETPHLGVFLEVERGRGRGTEASSSTPSTSGVSQDEE